MIVTIDGPAGAGKSSAARRLAQRLGFRFLDTGAMYRAVTLAAVRKQIDLADDDALLAVAHAVDIDVSEDRVLLCGEDVTKAIRTLYITSQTRHAANHVGVRARLVELQRRFAQDIDVVTEGRDQASIVFPDAQCKVFLTAGEQHRARRRFQDLLDRGEEITFDQVLQKQRRRDEEDCSRSVGALRQLADSVVVNTDDMTPDQVVDKLESIVHDCMAATKE